MKKLLSAILAITITVSVSFFALQPQKAEATGLPVVDILLNSQFAASQAAKIAEKGADGILWTIVNGIISNMTTSVVRWINTGFQGSPTFVTNPEAFFKDSLDQVTGNYINQLGLSNALCAPNSLQIRIALLKTNVHRQTIRYSCTLDAAIKNLDGFYNNFQNGGWKTWIQLSSESNDPYSQYLNALDDLDMRKLAKQGTITKELDWGRGFLSIKDPNHPNKTTTPGSVVQEQLNKALGYTTDRLIVADSFDEIAGALINLLIDKTLTGAGGILGLSGGSAKSTDYLAKQEVAVQQEQARVAQQSIGFIQADITTENAYIAAKSGELSLLQNTYAQARTALACLQRTRGSIPPGTGTTAPAPGGTAATGGATVTGANGSVTLGIVVDQNITSVQDFMTKTDAATSTLIADINRTQALISTLTSLSTKAKATNDATVLVSVMNSYQTFRTTLNGAAGVQTAGDEAAELQTQLGTVQTNLQKIQTACTAGTLLQPTP